jgi:hypothetical protein
MYVSDSTLPFSRYLIQSLYIPEYDEIAERGGRVVPPKVESDFKGQSNVWP